MTRKLLISGILVVTGMVAGWYLGKTPSYRQEVAKSQAVTETRTITTRQPGGVVTIDKTVKRVENREETKHVPPTTPAKPNYSLGLGVRHATHELPTYLVTAGHRLLGDLWLEVGTTEKLDEVRVGVRVDF